MKEIDIQYTDFFSKVIFVQLLNSGKSSVSDKQDVIISDLYKQALALLKMAAAKEKVIFFFNVYDRAASIVPSQDFRSVMKHPEMYDKIMASKADFYAEAGPMVARMRHIQARRAAYKVKKEIVRE